LPSKHSLAALAPGMPQASMHRSWRCLPRVPTGRQEPAALALRAPYFFLLHLERLRGERRVKLMQRTNAAPKQVQMRPSSMMLLSSIPFLHAHKEVARPPPVQGQVQEQDNCHTSKHRDLWGSSFSPSLELAC